MSTVALLNSTVWTDGIVNEAEELWLVEFYINNCNSSIHLNRFDLHLRFFAGQHCQELRPTWEKLANVVKNLARVGAVDCEEHFNTAICNIYADKGYPSIHVFPPGIGFAKKAFPYRYEHDLESLIELVMGVCFLIKMQNYSLQRAEFAALCAISKNKGGVETLAQCCSRNWPLRFHYKSTCC